MLERDFRSPSSENLVGIASISRLWIVRSPRIAPGSGLYK
jgi:hypothetical protein